MPSTIPEHKVQEIREANDVFDLVSSYVTLKKKGRNYFGLCPFHQEKSPSFSVNPEKQIFHCFGCGVGGNVFTYMMRHEGMSFPESVKFLAQRAGIPLEFEEIDASASRANESLYYINEFAAGFFKETLSAASGKAALQYLKDRGFSQDDIEAFGIGFAPSGWDGLINHAKKEGVEPEQLSRAGLILQKSSGGAYDRFRNRVMFTIWNVSGRVVAFGGRKLTDEDDSPKYINSPETTIYEKGKLLYGLYQNRDAIRQMDRAIFVEGYTDLLSLVSHGIKNVTATSGTALTEDQARLIRRYTKNVVLMYDSDAAGLSATLRGADILITHDIEVAIATLPPGDDPDSLVRRNGAEGVRKYLEGAPNLFDFKLQQLMPQPPEKRGDLIKSLLESLAKLNDNIHRSMMLRKASETLKIDERILWSELQGVIRQKRRRPTRTAIGQRLKELSKTPATRKVDVALQDLVRILIHRWELADVIFENLDFTLIEDSGMKAVLNYLKNRFKADRMPKEKDLVNSLNDIEVTSFIVRVFTEQLDELDFGRTHALDCVSTIKRERIQSKLTEVRKEMRQAQESGLPVKELLQDCVALENEKKKLEEQFVSKRE